MMNKYIVTAILLIGMSTHTLAQDTIHAQPICKDSVKYKLGYKQLIVPAALIGIGIVGVNSDWLKARNGAIKEEITENIDKKITIDDFSQYAPMVAVYGLNLCGIKGEHNLRDRTMILAISYSLMGITVNGLKRIAREERPDGSNNGSFPSGHTATAFMGAEFLWNEYKNVSPWIGVAGYAVAAGTGFFRMYNNKHWLTDVLGGAGIGMLSTKVAYYVYPRIKNKLFKSKSLKNVSLIPYYSPKNSGLYCQISF